MMAGSGATPAVEAGGGHTAAAGPPPSPDSAGPPPSPDSGHAFWSATLTLTLAILGSSVLPLPFVFSRLGVVPGLAVMLAVSGGNAVAGTLLLRAAGALGRRSYEGLAEAVGGPAWKAFTQAALVLLLAGNVIGDFCLLADMGVRAAHQLFPGTAGPGPWLAAAGGRAAAAALAVAVVFPLSCLRRMRQLERLGASGFLFVVLLAAVITRYSLADGLPALASGELPLWRPALPSGLPEAVGVLSFAFYLTPMLVPLLNEMPAGRQGVELTAKALQVTTVGIACVTYLVLGFFGAARYGLRTQGDVMMNEWLGGRWEGALSAGMLLYLTVSVAPMAMTLRCQLEDLFIGEAREGTPRPRGRQVALTAAAIAACLAPALAFPRQAEKVFAVTGATAVCAVVYIMPVAIHLRLFFRRGGSDCLGWLGAKAPRRQSFSFDLNSAQPGAAAAAGTRWLLADDHLGAGGGTEGGPPLPSLQVGAPQAQPSQQAQQAAGLRLPAAQRLGQAADEEEGEAAAAASAAAVAMRGHRSDLSLNRWLLGMSHESLGHNGDSLPQTPRSPRSLAAGGPRDSWDAAAPEDLLQQQQQQQQQAWGASGGPEAQGPATSAQLWGGPELAPLPAVPEAAPAGALPPVPEHAVRLVQLQRSLSSAHNGGSGTLSYPCITNVGTGWAAVGPLCWHVVLPLTVLAAGVLASLSALLLAVAAMRARS